MKPAPEIIATRHRTIQALMNPVNQLWHSPQVAEYRGAVAIILAITALVAVPLVSASVSDETLVGSSTNKTESSFCADAVAMATNPVTEFIKALSYATLPRLH
ncbi:MAG: hypothetical protein SFY80_15910 [Verrucomicrobiota bacterium]|nr:hypothetical protein [Verrucomicrobiota bacterium]